MKTVKTKKKAEQPTDNELKLEATTSKAPVKKTKKTEETKSNAVTNNATKIKKKIEANKVIEETEKKLLRAYGNFKFLLVYLLLAILAILAGIQANKINEQKNEINEQKNSVTELSNRVEELQNQTAVEIVNNRRIFVCNMEEIYKQLNINERNTDFELKIAKLDSDVTAAHKKIKNLKNAKVKADFTDVYLNSLVAKRDKVVEEYQDALHDTMAKINQAMAQVAVEQKANTIFRSQAVTALTKYTVDVTQEVLKKINEMK